MHIQPRLALYPLVALCLAMVTGHPAYAQFGPRPFSALELERLGLEKVWSGQLPVDPVRSKVETFRQVVSLKNPQVVYQVEHGGRVATFSSTELNYLGHPLGEEGAKAKAEQHMARLDTRTEEPKLTRQEVPSITFMAQSDAGMLMAIDGRTGRVEWTQMLGRRGYPQPRPDANDDIVVTINGFNLNCLHRVNGVLMWSKELEGMPTAGPAIGEDHIYVPLMDGTVLVYDFDGGPSLIPRYKSLGRIYNPLVATENSVAWSTDRDYFYVGYADRPLVRYRIESTGEIVAPASGYGPLQLFFTTLTGYVYNIYATDGTIQWRFSCGQPIDKSAVPIGDGVYVALQRGGMYKLQMNDGEIAWFAPRIRQFLAANDQYVYCLDDNRTIAVLDVNSGARLGALDVAGYDFFYTNFETDRIILGTQGGRMVVLRSRDLPYPQVHIDVKPPGEKPEAPAEGEEKAADDAPMDEPAVNPFAAPGDGGNVPNPFGGAGDDAADPFGAAGGDAGSDPFGAGGSGASEDPFGGGANPFGGAGDAGSDPFGASGGDAASDPFGASDNPFGN